ncbi:hypothetical protein ACIA8E_21610 [Streptomyces sp. NPDC051664]|uniref:hypothetical protein n=1 Tax=Streptomyces sp. NPDC051664 TaxID=3365668 RepID=UPI0037AADB59
MSGSRTVRKPAVAVSLLPLLTKDIALAMQDLECGKDIALAMQDLECGKEFRAVHFPEFLTGSFHGGAG